MAHPGVDLRGPHAIATRTITSIPIFEAGAWLRPVILGVSWLLALLYAYPGLMSTDSVVQLMQARGLEPISDGNPPMMAMIWRGVDRVITGPFGMLVLQTGAFLCGLDAILRRLVSPRAAAIVAGAVLLFPPVLAPMAVIWKDSQMAGYLIAGIALLLARGWWTVAGCIALSLATAFRYNAAAATLPIIVLLLHCRWTGIRRCLLAVAVWVAITASAFAVNRALTQREDHLWHSFALMDLAGTIRYSHGWKTDADLERALAGTPLVVHEDILKWARWNYWPRNHWAASHGPKRMFDPPTTQAHRDAIESAWWRVVQARPAAYLLHRWRVYEHVIGIAGKPWAPVWRRRVEAPHQARMVNVATGVSALQNTWFDANESLSSTWLFRPRFYLIVALVLLCLCRSRLSLALFGSGIAYELALFFVAPSPDFRYSHWLVTTTIVGVIVLFVSRLRGRRSCSP